MKKNDPKQILGGAAFAALLILPTLAHAEPPAPPAPPAPVVQAVPAPVAPLDDHTKADIAAARAEARRALKEHEAEVREAAREAAEQAREQAREAAEQAREQTREAAEQAREAAREYRDRRYADASSSGGQWITWPRRNFSVKAVHVDSLVGSVTVDVKDSGPVTMDVSGNKALLDSMEAGPRGDTLYIEGGNVDTSVWDWRKWFDFPNYHSRRGARVDIKLVVPKGTALNIESLVGDATIGDTMGPLKFEAAASKAKIGHVTEAKLTLSGAGRIDIADVAGELSLEVAGSGRVIGGSAKRAKVDIAGAGDATLGTINGGLNLDVAGSGNLTVARVNGPVDIDVAGSGSVKIGDGVADPFHVDILGSGKVAFGGNAVNPNISAMGSGNVWMKSYTGKLSSDGMVNVKVGSND